MLSSSSPYNNSSPSQTNSLSSLLHLQGLPPLPRSLASHHSHKSTPTSKRPLPPPRPHSRRSSSSGSSFRASPEHVSSNKAAAAAAAPSPRSLSSSPHSPHTGLDSGLGRSSVDSFDASAGSRAFVRVVKSPSGSRLDAQLSQLRRDMQQLRQQDMSLLGHLLGINQGIQDLKNVLVPPPQPAPSSHLGLTNHIPMYHQGSPAALYGNTPLYGNHPLLPRTSYVGARRSSLEESVLGAVGGIRQNNEEESDSISSSEFGDV